MKHSQNGYTLLSHWFIVVLNDQVAPSDVHHQCWLCWNSFTVGMVSSIRPQKLSSNVFLCHLLRRSFYLGSDWWSDLGFLVRSYRDPFLWIFSVCQTGSSGRVLVVPDFHCVHCAAVNLWSPVYRMHVSELWKEAGLSGGIPHRLIQPLSYSNTFSVEAKSLNSNSDALPSSFLGRVLLVPVSPLVGRAVPWSSCHSAPYENSSEERPLM